MSDAKIKVRCGKCDKPPKSFGQYLVPEGMRWTVNCHGETAVRDISHHEMKKRVPTWLMIGKFNDTCFTFSRGD